MKHIIKVETLQNLPETRPLIAMDANRKLQWEGQVVGPTIEMIDLGLSVKWAKYLYGVNPNQLSNASDWYGKYLMWGELEEKAGWDGQETKVPYNWTNYIRHTNGTYSSSNKKVFIKYVQTNKPEYWAGTGNPDNLTTLESIDDIASVNYEGNWRIPTKADFEELINNTTSQWITNYNEISGLNGRVFTSKVNSNTLFVPANGQRYDSDLLEAGSGCYLWSSSLRINIPYRAYHLFFNLDNILTNVASNRCNGYSVLPVC